MTQSHKLKPVAKSMEVNYVHPRVGVGVMLAKDGKILLGKRRNSHGEGEWALIGGKLEHGEAIAACAHREIMEEAGLEVQNVKFSCVINSTRHLPKHFVAIGLTADWLSGEPQVFPEERISEWGWFSLNDLPQPMFFDSAQVIRAHLAGTPFTDLE